MTTSPVMGITEELLAELELHARQAVCDAITDGFPYDPRIGLTTIEENFCVAANPATILALTAHIRSLTERLGMMREAVKDVLWCIDTDPSCQIGVVERCKCSMCVAGRLRAALAQQPAPAAPVAQEPAAWPAAAHNLVRDWQTGMASSNEVCIALASALCGTPPAVEQPDAWTPSGADDDRNIHRNPDAAAWADLFVATFPGLADKHDLMHGWFANAMMAMHDHLKAQQPDTVAVPRELYTCVGKGGEYELLGRSLGAGERRLDRVVVYRDTETGLLYHRSLDDFDARMALLDKEGDA